MLSMKVLSSPTIGRGLKAFSPLVNRNTVTARFCVSNPRIYYVNARRTFTSKPPSGASNSVKKETAEVVSSSAKKGQGSFLQRWMAHKEIPPRGTVKWYGEMTLICTVFAITGTSTMVMVRPAVSEVLGLQGSLKDGPWSYRICSLVIMTPLYSAMLVVVGVST